ncbi:MAG: bifunctional enoyl-CoA hydratase/phosphate acetyltransferase [Alphaproteobacteria bacterium]|nr:bifunctional enoyl-CoA hydratase/phosphate acetyltransferase [Alphaproteobacteria bacterium]
MTTAAAPSPRLAIGQTARLERLCRAEDLITFAAAAGDLNPLTLPGADKDGDGRPDADATTEAPAAWIAALFSAAFGTLLPGPGARLVRQTLRHRAPVWVGETVLIEIAVTALGEDGLLTLSCRAAAPDGRVIAEGEADVRAPATPLAADPGALPRIVIARHQHFQRLLAACDPLPPVKTAIVAPEEEKALAGALAAAARGIIEPILVGDRARILSTAAAAGLDIGAAPIVEAATPDLAAAAAVALVNAGAAAALMKGALHTDELLHHVVKREGGLRAGRRITHVFVFDVPGHPHLLHVSDAAIAIAPTLEEKVDIVQNAIDLARALGCATPRVGVLSAVETVNPKIPSTLDAAALSKMAERGQIRGGVVDGPLAMDNAVDPGAARTKGLRSTVAGQADVLIAPNIEAGNILVKELAFLSHAEGAGLVLGAKAPIILTSRADDETSRLVSCAIAMLFEDWRRTGVSRL